MYGILKPALFALDAEDAHDLALWTAARTPRVLAKLWAPRERLSLAQSVFRRAFKHPLGLAAGVDKNGTAIAFWEAVGFSFAELGTVTPNSQVGNDRPRLFRAEYANAIINRMGFNNNGSAQLADRVGHYKGDLILGASIGKAKDTPLEHAADDYASCAQKFMRHTKRPTYYAVNVSSPNTAGLRSLQTTANLSRIFNAIRRIDATTPIAVKISPDMTEIEVREVARACLGLGVDAIIAVNTTMNRPPEIEIGTAGGLSGSPLTARALELTRDLFIAVRGMIPIIGVGGISDANDAYRRIRAGATLLQIYTALVYRGPGLVREIVNGLALNLEKDCLRGIEQAIGRDV